MKAIVNAAEGKDILFKELENGKDVTIDAPNVVKFDGMPLEEKQTMRRFFNALTSDMWRKMFVDEIDTKGDRFFDEDDFDDFDNFKDFVDTYGKNALEGMKAALKETGHYDALNKILQFETRMAADKAIIIGSVCGVIAALAVSAVCFAVGAPLSTLAIAGIAVAAALAVGIIAGGITYAVLKPSDKLEDVHVQGREREQEQDKIPLV